MNFEQFKREFEEFQETDRYAPESSDYDSSENHVTEEDLKQVIEKDAYGEEREADVNAWVSDDGDVAVYGRDTEIPSPKRSDDLQQAEQVLQQNAHGEKVNDVKVVQDSLGVRLRGDDVKPTGIQRVIEEIDLSETDYSEDDFGSLNDPDENFLSGESVSLHGEETDEPEMEPLEDTANDLHDSPYPEEATDERGLRTPEDIEDLDL